MSSKGKKKSSPKMEEEANSEAVEQETIQANPEEVENAEEETPSEPTVEDPIAKAETLANEMKDRYLRINAEFENYKKRMTREGADRLKYYNLDLIKELLPSLDNLDRAIVHGKNETSDTNSMIEGLEMVYKMTQEVFVKFGVSRVKTTGEAFDPNCHQAVGVVESETLPDNQVVEECLGGYFLHDRIIRPAMVRVSGKA